jgi:hypothetical protein
LQSKKKGKHSLGIEKSKGKGSKVFATEESSLKRDNIKSARSTRSQKVESWKYEEGKGRVISSALREESTSARKEKETEQVISSSSKEYPPQLERKKGNVRRERSRAPYVCACLRCVMSFCAPPFPTSSEVVKKNHHLICNHYRHLGLSVGAALCWRTACVEEKARKERNRETSGKGMWRKSKWKTETSRPLSAPSITEEKKEIVV